MTYLRLAARILLGAGFTLFGAMGWAMAFGAFKPPPPPSPMAGQFFEVFFNSHWLLLVDTGELVGGLLLLGGVFVPLALCILGAILTNILMFHIGINPSGIAPGLVFTALWIVVATGYPGFFRILFSAHAPEAVAGRSELGA